MRKILLNKAGVTVLEGVIALGLLALVTGGAFAVLLAASRQTTQPDIREEMILAVEKANDMLKAYTPWRGSVNQNPVPDSLRNGLCGEDVTPLQNGDHNIGCLLPPICDANNSTFTYTVAGNSVTFNITCNGYSL